VNDLKFFDASLPQTLQASVMLLYFEAFFILLGASFISVLLRVFAGPLTPLLVGAGMVVGAVGIASRRKRGYMTAVISALVPAVFIVRFLTIDFPNGSGLLSFLISIAFYIALVAALLHRQSREYQRVWFE
jgi:FtsH-binding integral membrane protein